MDGRGTKYFSNFGKKPHDMHILNDHSLNPVI